MKLIKKANNFVISDDLRHHSSFAAFGQTFLMRHLEFFFIKKDECPNIVSNPQTKHTFTFNQFIAMLIFHQIIRVFM
jgi:hypothetical protein